jgi:hypothetical protein
MKNESMDELAAKITARKRIGFGDMRRIQRDILPDGIVSRRKQSYS